MQVTSRRYDGAAEKTIDVLPDLTLNELREVEQMLLGLPESTSFRLFLERTNQELENSSTLQQAGIRQNDRIILLPLNISRSSEEIKVQDNFAGKEI